MQWRTAGSGCWGGALNIPYTLPLPFPSLPLMLGLGIYSQKFLIFHISLIFISQSYVGFVPFVAKQK
jgi:hypothetical protein